MAHESKIKSIARKFDTSFRIFDNARMLKRFLSKHYPLKKDNVSCVPFFIIGSGRSGNTLLRAILTQHPNISIPPESYVLPKVVRKYQHYSFLEWKELVKIVLGEFESHHDFYTWEIDFSPLYQRVLNFPEEKKALNHIIDEIYNYYSEQKFSGATIWGDKTPLNTLHLEWLDKVFDEAKYIHIIRDGRDVINSYKKSGLYNIETSSQRWVTSIQKARNFSRKKQPGQYMELRYEDLVTTPESEIKRVCDFLSVDYRDSMLNYQQNVSNLGDVALLSHHDNLKNKINPNSIGKWQNDIYYDEIKHIEQKIESTLIELGYKKQDK